MHAYEQDATFRQRLKLRRLRQMDFANEEDVDFASDAEFDAWIRLRTGILSGFMFIGFIVVCLAVIYAGARAIWG